MNPRGTVAPDLICYTSQRRAALPILSTVSFNSSINALHEMKYTQSFKPLKMKY